ncbi:hypothetical protein [Saccharothrix xinjiangensis]|uniref:Histidyl-tRNA synthetase n=1 Tax=Saccharothrix xinjiangensis TaxID=204798 RepID=A0ABV9XUJ7_9PSEU
MGRRPALVNGFPEWPPHVRAAELRWLDHVRRVVGSHGFCPVATPSLEPLEEGEDPREGGRFRESTWCALGVVDAGRLSPRFDAELPRVAHEVLSGLDLPAWTIGVGNRKVLAGFCEGLGVDDPLTVLRAVARLGEIGVDGVAEALRWSLTGEQVHGLLQPARTSARAAGAGVSRVRPPGGTCPVSAWPSTWAGSSPRRSTAGCRWSGGARRPTCWWSCP